MKHGEKSRKGAKASSRSVPAVSAVHLRGEAEQDLAKRTHAIVCAQSVVERGEIGAPLRPGLEERGEPVHEGYRMNSATVASEKYRIVDQRSAPASRSTARSTDQTAPSGRDIPQKSSMR